MENLLTVGVPALLGGVLFFFVLERMVQLSGFLGVPDIRNVWRFAILTAVTFTLLFLIPIYTDRLLDGRDLFHSWVFVQESIFFWVGAGLAHYFYSIMTYGKE